MATEVTVVLSAQSAYCLGTRKGGVPMYNKGPFKYYVGKKVGGWGMTNTYVCLHGGWVGMGKCIRNKKSSEKMIF